MVLRHVEHLLYFSFAIIGCSTFRVHTYILTPIGIDEREKVEIPDSRIALIISKFPDKGFSRGTAFLISGGEYFATAAHCLYDKETAQNPE